MKLTKSTVNSLVPDPHRDRFLWDDDLSRFGIRIKPNGTASFLIQYRNAGGTSRRMTIGSTNVLSVGDARKAAKRLLAEVESGGDPAATKKSHREAPTMRSLAEEYFRVYAEPRKRPNYLKNDRSMMDKIILPALGSRKVADVQVREIEKLHRDLKRTPYRANRVVALLSKMFSLAIKWGYRPDSPCKGVDRYPEEQKENWLNDEQLARFLDVLNAHPNRRAALAVKLLVLTGARKTEVLGATWDQFDLKAGVWTKPSAHTKQKRLHRVPLSPASVTVLQELWEARTKSIYLFPGNKPRKPLPGKKQDQPLKDIKNFWRRVCKQAGVSGLRIHDLRHTYASHLVSGGGDLYVVGKLLGHTQAQTTRRYAHLADDPLRQLATQFGLKVDAAGNPDAATIEREPILRRHDPLVQATAKPARPL